MKSQKIYKVLVILSIVVAGVLIIIDVLKNGSNL
tara:strand:- start:3467 stop:3568 length:102 start_codon:yes stop_codon:yes gene_type:complete